MDALDRDGRVEEERVRVREQRRRHAHLLNKEPIKIVLRLWPEKRLKPRPESGRGCLICAGFVCGRDSRVEEERVGVREQR